MAKALTSNVHDDIPFLLSCHNRNVCKSHFYATNNVRPGSALEHCKGKAQKAFRFWCRREKTRRSTTGLSWKTTNLRRTLSRNPFLDTFYSRCQSCPLIDWKEFLIHIKPIWKWSISVRILVDKRVEWLENLEFYFKSALSPHVLFPRKGKYSSQRNREREKNGKDLIKKISCVPNTTDKNGERASEREIHYLFKQFP